MLSAVRRNMFIGVGNSTAKLIFTVGAHSEVGAVAVCTNLSACFEGMARAGEDHVFAQLEEVAVGLHYRSRSRVEGFKQSVAELDARVGVVGCGKSTGRACDAQGRLKNQPWREAACVGAHHVALPVNVLNTERRIDRRLVRICRWAHQIIEVEACKELIFGRSE